MPSREPSKYSKRQGEEEHRGGGAGGRHKKVMLQGGSHGQCQIPKEGQIRKRLKNMHCDRQEMAGSSAKVVSEERWGCQPGAWSQSLNGRCSQLSELSRRP